MIRALFTTLASLALVAVDVEAAVAPGDGGSAVEQGVVAGADTVLARWTSRIEPADDELSWQTIPWLPSLWEGLATAGRQEKPLLLWVMNGHPLGCT